MPLILSTHPYKTMKTILKHVLLILAFSLPLSVLAGIKWVDIGVNGLTCSMCTRSVEMSVRRLSFVDSVVMSLEKTEGRVYVKQGDPINLKAIAKAVVDAGFSVRFLRVEFVFNDIEVNQDGSFLYQGQQYIWLDYKNGSAKGDVSLKLVDDYFLPHKESSVWKKRIGDLSQKAFHVVQG